MSDAVVHVVGVCALFLFVLVARAAWSVGRSRRQIREDDWQRGVAVRNGRWIKQRKLSDTSMEERP